jgi:hypothetical protein
VAEERGVGGGIKTENELWIVELNLYRILGKCHLIVGGSFSLRVLVIDRIYLRPLPDSDGRCAQPHTINPPIHASQS